MWTVIGIIWLVALVGLAVNGIITVKKKNKKRNERRERDKKSVYQPQPEFRGEILDRMLVPGGFVREKDETDWDFVRRIAIDFFRQKQDFKYVATIIFGKSPTQLDDTEKWLYYDTWTKIANFPHNNRGKKQAEFAVKNFIRGFGDKDPATF